MSDSEKYEILISQYLVHSRLTAHWTIPYAGILFSFINRRFQPLGGDLRILITYHCFNFCYYPFFKLRITGFINFYVILSM